MDNVNHQGDYIDHLERKHHCDRPLVDMTDPGEMNLGRSSSQFRSKGNSRDRDFINFEDPYSHSDSGRHHLQSFEGKHSHHEAGKQGNDRSNQQQLLQLEQALEKVLEKLIQAFHQGQDTGADSTKTGASSPEKSASSTSENSASKENTSQAVNSQHESTTAAATTGDTQSSADDAQSSTNNDQTPVRDTADINTINRVLAQSGTSTGKLSLDAAVNNASVVGFVGPTKGKTADPNSSAEFRNMKSYIHLKSGGWKQIEDQANSEIIGGHGKADMKGDNESMTVHNESNLATMAAPPDGWVDHFWLHDGGGVIDPNEVDGFFSSAEAKANVPNSGLEASLGIDWFKPDGSSDGRFGTGTPLTDQWQTLYHTTLDTQTLANDPPPGIAGGAESPAQEFTTPSNPPANEYSGSQKLIDLFPKTDHHWQQLIEDAPKGSLIVSMSASDLNPKYDQPFDNIDPSLAQHISEASHAGLKPLGYVGTANGTKPLAVAKSEIDDWYRNADVKGIYLGNSGKADDSGYATDAASEAYYEELANYIRAKGGIAAINGSGTPNLDYMQFFDVQGTMEDSINNLAMHPEAAWQPQYSPDRFSAAVGDVSISNLKQAIAELRTRNNGYIAVGDTWPKPLTDEYWAEEIAALSDE